MNMMRMVCDTPAIIKGSECRDCPKLDELVRVLDEVLADPDVKVIVSSGSSSYPIMANFRSHGFCGCVSKPYRVRDLTQTLREHLTRH